MDEDAIKGGIPMVTAHWTPGKGKPNDYTIACFVDAAAAQGALEGLQRDGFTPEDMVMLSGIDAYEKIRQNEESSLFRRISLALENATGDGVTGRGEYVAELKKGNAVVFVYAPDEAAQERAYQTIKAADGYRISHYGQWVNTNL